MKVEITKKLTIVDNIPSEPKYGITLYRDRKYYGTGVEPAIKQEWFAEVNDLSKEELALIAEKINKTNLD